MTTVDWIIVAFTILMATWGYAQGLVVGALSLAGFVGGGFIGSRLGPLLLHNGARSPYAPVFALAGAFLIGGLLASTLEVVGLRLRRYLRGPLGVVDGAGARGGDGAPGDPGRRPGRRGLGRLTAAPSALSVVARHGA